MTRRILVLLACLWPGLAFGQVAENATSSGCTTGTTLTIAHTVAGANRVLVVLGFTFNGATVSSMTWDTSQALTWVTAQAVAGGDPFLYAYRLIAPNTGTHNVVVTTSSSQDQCAMVFSVTGAHQTTPIGTPVGDASTGAPLSHAHDTTSEPNGLVLDWFVFYGTANTLTVNGGQTTEVAATEFASAFEFIFTSEAGATTVNTGYSWDIGFTPWGHITVPVSPAAGGGGGSAGYRSLLGVGR